LILNPLDNLTAIYCQTKAPAELENPEKNRGQLESRPMIYHINGGYYGGRLQNPNMKRFFESFYEISWKGDMKI